MGGQPLDVMVSCSVTATCIIRKYCMRVDVIGGGGGGSKNNFHWTLSVTVVKL